MSRVPPRLEPWSEEILYFEGDPYFQALIEAIDGAQSSILFEVYIFNLDRIGKRLLAALARAAARKVHVKVTVDGIGSPDWSSELVQELNQKGIETRIYHPFWQPFESPFGNVQEQVLMTLPERLIKFWKRLQRLNRRNHRKLAVIDDSIAFVGSFNVSEVHLAEFSKDQAWRDSAVQVRGRNVVLLRDIFMHTWLPGRKRWFWRKMRKLGNRLSDLIRINVSLGLRRQFRSELIRRINTAKQRIWITNPYFVPERKIMSALQAAGRRGIDVRIIVPEHMDVRFMKWVARHVYTALLSRGIRFFEFKDRVVHAKTLIIDEWATVGSSNFNHRSLLHDLELDVVLNEEKSLVALKAQFEKDLARSNPFGKNQLDLIPAWQWVLGNIILRLRYWI